VTISFAADETVQHLGVVRRIVHLDELAGKTRAVNRVTLSPIESPDHRTLLPAH
jgi:hypothetical protein